MGYNLKCPHCDEYFIDMQGEYEIDFDKGLFKCPKCGRTVSLDDTVEYDYELFNSTGLCM